MARIRKINVSQVEGNNNGVLPAGTIAAYEVNGEYVLRVHDGVTAGGVPFPNAPSIVHDNDINITVNNQDSSSYTWNFGQTGTLTAPGMAVFGGTDGIVVDDLNNGIAALFNNGDVYITGGGTVRFTGIDTTDGISESVLRFWNGEGRHSSDNDTTELVTLNVGNDAAPGSPTEGFLKIVTEKEVGEEKEWKFDANGVLHLPTSGDIVDSNGNSVLGGGGVNNNIWVETFALTDPEESIVQIATSVEYDADGNIFALFSHSIPGENNETYTSVAKLSPTGTIVWQVRFSANLNTDGWGLAYDGEDTVYVAGSTAGTPLTYDFATLTKIDAFDGTIVWNKTYDFEADSQSAVVDVDSDLDPIMVGYASNGTDNMIITTKVDKADGTVIWSKTLDGQGDDEAYGMAVGPTGEVVTIGYTDTFGVQNAADNLYADLEGNPNWTVGGSINFDGVTADFTFAAGIPTFTNIVDTVGGREVDDVLGTVLGSTIGGADSTDDMVVKVETTAANDTDNRMVVVKYAANGTIAWQKAVQFDADEGCRGADADIDADGNIYVCGNHDTVIGVAMSLVKFNSSGVKQWSRRVVGNCADFATSVVVGPDNNLYLSGVTSDINAENVKWAVAKYSTTGSVVWQRLIENTASWTFTGGIFFENRGGSNIAVGPDYVALAGGFGAFINDEDPTATVVQIDTNGTLFSIGDWALTAASFTGNLDDSASDITVINAGKTAGTATPTVADFNGGDDDSNFLIGTLYNAPSGDDSLVNGEYSVILGNTGTVTLPSGGTISEGVVTSNPTIQLTPASPTVASQKLVIKGGGGQYYITENGIDLGTNNNVWEVTDSATFYVYAPTRPNETLYWWIVPEEAGISTTMSGTVELGSEGEGVFNFTVISDAYEFRVRVSPEEDNYDPESIGVESVLINGDEPTYGDYHLHLTTGDLTETSIFLGTDDHNVRTTTDGKIQITTFVNSYTVNNVWEFGTDGALTLPNGGHIGPSGGKGAGTTYGAANDHLVSLTSYYNSGLYSSCVTAYADGTLNITAYNDGGPNPAKIWTFANDGTLTLPDNSGIKSSTNIDITIDTPDSSTFNWRFGADGDLTLPRGYFKNDTSDGFLTIEGPLFADMVSAGEGYNTISNGVQILTHAVGDDTERKFNFSWDGSLYMPTASNNSQVGAIEWRLDDGIVAQVKSSPGGGNPPIPKGLQFLTYGGDTATTISSGFTNKWIFRSDGTLTIPGDIRSEGNINIEINLSDSTQRVWQFGEDGNLNIPGDIVNSTGVSQTAQRVEGSWTLPDDTTDTYSFTVPMDGTYTMWVKGNIPNGIIIWNATVSVSNSNVPAIGTQYAWNYTGGGSPISLTSIPDQIKGVAGTISTDATYAGTTSNRFDFGISNTSGSTQTIYYGYTKIS